MSYYNYLIFSSSISFTVDHLPQVSHDLLAHFIGNAPLQQARHINSIPTGRIGHPLQGAESQLARRGVIVEGSEAVDRLLPV